MLHKCTHDLHVYAFSVIFRLFSRRDAVFSLKPRAAYILFSNNIIFNILIFYFNRIEIWCETSLISSESILNIMYIVCMLYVSLVKVCYLYIFK